MSDIGKLDIRRVRRSAAGKEFLEMCDEAACMVQLDLADLDAVLQGYDQLFWIHVEGDLDVYADRLAHLLAEGHGCVALQIAAQTLEETEGFIAMVNHAIGEDGRICYGVSWHGEGEVFSADLLIPAEKSIRGDDSIALPYGSVLRSRSHTYSDLEVFDAGGSSICYRAVDENGSNVLIKEVYPMSLARAFKRENDALVPASEHLDLRQSAVTSLILAVEESKKEKELEKDLNNDRYEFFERYRDYFEVNNTFYTVYYDYGQGTLAERAGKMTLREAVVLTGRILEHLEKLHRTYLHLDISPENILLSTVVDDVPSLKFIDLGSLMHKGQIEQATVFPCKDGYSPFELTSAQNSIESRSLIGDHTDTFAVGAVLYHLLTGKRVTWAVSRKGNRSIIRSSDPGICNSRSREITFYEGSGMAADEVQGVSPRVLEAVNEFLAKALTNSPYERFQTAAEMRQAIRELIQFIDSHEVYFGKMEMPVDFMEEAIRHEKETGLDRPSSLPGSLGRTAVYSAEDIRAILERDRGAVLSRCSLERAREAVLEYVEKYGERYHEILFVDESQEDCPLFSGKLDGSHAGIRQLDNDKKTLIVFYGRNKAIDSGIVEMVDAEERPVWSLEFVRQKGRPSPDVIRILPRKRNSIISMAAYSSRILMIGAPILIILLLAWAWATDSYIMHDIVTFFDPWKDPYGTGWLPIQMRTILQSCALFGPAEPTEAAAILSGSHFLPSTLLLYLLVNWGYVPVIALGGCLFMLLYILWEKARENYLSAAAFVVLTARILFYIIRNLGLLPSMAGDLWLSRSSFLFNCILLALILLWPRMTAHKDREHSWEGIRIAYGIVGQWLLRPFYASILSVSLFEEPSSILYLLWSLLSACVIDFAIETAFLHMRGRRSYRRLAGKRLFKYLGITDEEWEEFFDEEDELL